MKGKKRSRFRGSPNFRVRVTVRGFMEVVFLLEEQIRPYVPLNIPVLSAVEVCQAPQSVCLNDDALENMSFMFLTLDTSQLAMSPLNFDA